MWRMRQQFSLAGCTFLALALAGCGRGGDTPSAAAKSAASESAAGSPLVKVTPIRPVRKTLVRRTEQPGQVEAFEETPLFAKVAGYVAKIHVDIGDHVAGPRLDALGKMVQPGEVLAELA